MREQLLLSPAVPTPHGISSPQEQFIVAKETNFFSPWEQKLTLQILSGDKGGISAFSDENEAFHMAWPDIEQIFLLLGPKEGETRVIVLPRSESTNTQLASGNGFLEPIAWSTCARRQHMNDLMRLSSNAIQEHRGEHSGEHRGEHTALIEHSHKSKLRGEIQMRRIREHRMYGGLSATKYTRQYIVGDSVFRSSGIGFIVKRNIQFFYLRNIASVRTLWSRGLVRFEITSLSEGA